ncbi:hypothetical protein PTL48_15000, partial [Clostridium perfringens]|nr:hypothetical protein [Clostridium perfringens]
MAVSFSNLSTVPGLTKLDEFLLSRSYITGYQASNDDIAVFSSLGKVPGSEYINATRWYNHIAALLHPRFSSKGVGVQIGAEIEQSSAAPGTPPPASSKAPVEDDDDDDDVDLFGEETEEEKKAAEERAA